MYVCMYVDVCMHLRVCIHTLVEMKPPFTADRSGAGLVSSARHEPGGQRIRQLKQLPAHPGLAVASVECWLQKNV